MSAHLPPDSGGPKTGPLVAGGVTAVVGGAGLAVALAVAPSGAFDLVAAGGGPGLAVTVAPVAPAAQQLRSARRSRTAANQAQARALQLEHDIAGLAQTRRDTELVRREAELARRDAEEATAHRVSVEAEAALLSGQTLPAAFARVHAGDAVDQGIADAGRPASSALSGVLDLAAREVAAAERRGAAALPAGASAAARIQAQTTRMLAELREMEQRY